VSFGPGFVLRDDEEPPPAGPSLFKTAATIVATAFATAVGNKLGEWLIEEIRARLPKKPSGSS
jgi:hypothetical protein